MYNVRDLQLVRHRLTNPNQEREKFTVIAVYFNIVLSVIHGTTTSGIKSIDLNVLNQLDLIFIVQHAQLKQGAAKRRAPGRDL